MFQINSCEKCKYYKEEYISTYQYSLQYCLMEGDLVTPIDLGKIGLFIKAIKCPYYQNNKQVIL